MPSRTTSIGSGFDWGEHLYHASTIFEQLYAWAEHLIRAGKAYVDDHPRTTARHAAPSLAGRNSPFRDRSGREPRSVRRMRAWRDPQRRAGAARQDPRWRPATSTRAYPVLSASSTASHRPQPSTAWSTTELRLRTTAQSDADRGRHRPRSAPWTFEDTGRSTTGSENLPVARPIRIARLTSARRASVAPSFGVRPCQRVGLDRAHGRRCAGLRRRGVPPEALRVIRCGADRSSPRPTASVDVAMYEYAVPRRAQPHGTAAHGRCCGAPESRQHRPARRGSGAPAQA